MSENASAAGQPTCDACSLKIKKPEGSTFKQCAKCNLFFHAKCIQLYAVVENNVELLVCANCLPPGAPKIKSSAKAKSAANTKATSTMRDNTEVDKASFAMEMEKSQAQSTIENAKAALTTDFLTSKGASTSASTSADNKGDSISSRSTSPFHSQFSSLMSSRLSTRDSSLERSSISQQEQTEEENVTLKAILDRLESLDKRQERMEKNQANLVASNSAIQEQLKTLDELAGLPDRVTQVETEVEDVRTRLSNLEKEVKGLNKGSSAVSSKKSRAELSALSKKMDALERKSADVRRQIIISGLPTAPDSNLRVLAHAVVALDSSVLLREVVSVRRLTRRHPAGTSDTVSDDDGTAAYSQSTPTTSSGFSPMSSLVVTLSSDALVRSTIAAKVRRGKLSTTELDSDLLLQGRAPSPIPCKLINVNEFLHKDLHKLRMDTVRLAKDNNCITYVRNGQIFIRTKDNRRAEIIKCRQNLDDFLGRLAK